MMNQPVKTKEELVNEYASKIKEVDDKEEIVALLQKFLREARATRSNGKSALDRLEEMDTIAEVRRFIQIAHAKKSKAKGKPEVEARYEEEIRLGQEKLNELLAMVDDPKELLEKGEDTSRVLQAWILKKEGDLKSEMMRIGAITGKDNLTRRAKSLLKEVEIYVAPELEKEIEETIPEGSSIFKDRLERGDKRVWNIVRMFNFLRSDLAKELQKEDEKDAIRSASLRDKPIEEIEYNKPKGKSKKR